MNTFVEFDLDDIVTRNLEEPTAVTARAAYRKKQAKAKRLIFESIKDGMMPLVQSLPTAKDCMDTLSKLYDVDAPSLKRSLKRELFTMKMDKNETVASFFSRIAQLKEQLSTIAVVTEPMTSWVWPLTSFLIHGLHSLLRLLGEVNLRLLHLRSSSMNALKRKPDFREGLDPWVRLVVKRILSCLPSSRRTRGLGLRSLRKIVTYLTFGVSIVIS